MGEGVNHYKLYIRRYKMLRCVSSVHSVVHIQLYYEVPGQRL